MDYMSHTDIRGHLVLIMAPMASGKGSLISYVQSEFPQITRLTSCTTRSARPGEVDGVEYFFISREVFERKIENGEFIEWAEFSGNLYGTLHTELMGRLEKGEVVINEIDLQGVIQLMRLIPRDRYTLIYIDAGGWETLKARALARAPISEEHLELRKVRYEEEDAFKSRADFVIQNGDGELEEAKLKLHTIIEHIIYKAST